MKGLIVVGIIVGIIATIAVLLWLGVLAVRYATKTRNRKLWEAAEANPQWEEFCDFRDGQTVVGIRLVARVGQVTRQKREELMPGFPCPAPDMVDIELGLAEARRRMVLLNK